jgi:hypothetical protein
MAEHLPIHVLDYGHTGGGKSTTAATFPKPMIVFMWDPFGKDTPYLARGIPSELFSDERAGFVREVHSKKDGRLLIRLEYYHETGFYQPEMFQLGKSQRLRMKDMLPEAYNRFLNRMAVFHTEYEQWKTVVFDSVTFAEICARKWDQHVINPAVEDPRQWWASSTDMMEQMLMIRFASLPMNVVTIAHVDEQKDEVHGTFLRSPAAPGARRPSTPSGEAL